MSNQLIKHSLIYSLAQFFVMFAGLISFPVLTKNLSPEEYGLIGLLTVTISVVASFGKLGLQHSILRYRENFEKSIFISNIFYLVAIGPVIIWCTFSLITLVLFELDIIEGDNLDIILIVFFIAFSEQIRGFIVNFFVSSQHSNIVAKLKIVSKTISVFFTLSAVLLLLASARGFIYGLVTAEVIIFLLTIYTAKQQGLFTEVTKKKIDPKIYKPFLIFGLPLLGLEMVNMLHAFVDRYLIKYYMEDSYLGYYSAYYNMATMISELVIGGLAIAIVPAYMKTWNEHGKEKTESLLNKIFNILLLICPIIVTSLWVVSAELFELLTTPEYVTHAYLLPIIAIGVFCHAATPLFSAGLKIKKASMTMFYCVIFSAILNLVLNIIFIPLYGLVAAAITTTISYGFISVSFIYLGASIITPKINIFILVRSCIYSAVFLFLSGYIQHDVNAVQLTMKVGAGVLYFCLVFILFEKALSTFFIDSLLKRNQAVMK